MILFTKVCLEAPIAVIRLFLDQSSRNMDIMISVVSL